MPVSAQSHALLFLQIVDKGEKILNSFKVLLLLLGVSSQKQRAHSRVEKGGLRLGHCRRFNHLVNHLIVLIKVWLN